jgi:hypothetical protein
VHVRVGTLYRVPRCAVDWTGLERLDLLSNGYTAMRPASLIQCFRPILTETLRGCKFGPNQPPADWSRKKRGLIFLFSAVLLAGCASAPPSNTANICSIFQEKEDWYASAKAAAERWHTPIAVQMAIINQESSFVDDARPPRVRFLGIPLWRPTTAYGYSQATDATWERYLGKTGNSGADRDDFGDATDFIGWYTQQSHLQLGLAKSDAYNQYLAYHEGQGGYQRGSWRDKPALQSAARKVAATASRYQRQLATCQPELESSIAD